MRARSIVSTVVVVLLAVPCALFGPATPGPAPVPAGTSAWLAEAQGLADAYPDVVGNLDGAPVALRYRANQQQDPRWAGRQILSLDRRGDGRITEVYGDLAAATRVVVLVPGVDDTLANFDSGHGGVLRRSPSWQGRQLYRQMSGNQAVITWLGYNTPEAIRRDAIREDQAARGAADLDRFVDALVLGRPDRQVTVVGHSYGSTVAGLAARRLSPQVTDIVAIGSPGMGADRVADLHTTARVWAGSAPSDWTRRLPGVQLFGAGHGRLPFEPEFGALPLPCDNVAGHDGYFLPGSAALSAIAAIGEGTPDDPR